MVGVRVKETMNARPPYLRTERIVVYPAKDGRLSHEFLHIVCKHVEVTKVTLMGF